LAASALSARIEPAIKIIGMMKIGRRNLLWWFMAHTVSELAPHCASLA
jgi:hypothetical protein